MARKCKSGAICFDKITFLLILFLTGLITYILLKSSSLSLFKNVISTPQSMNQPVYHYDIPIRYDNPYIPPLRDNKFYTQHIGIPINIPTQTVDTNYGPVGILTRVNGKETILPLFGRAIIFNRDKWQYYAMSDRNNNIKLPISQNGKSCTNEYGCDSLCNGDTVYVEGYNDAFKVTIYENNVPRYIPYI